MLKFIFFFFCAAAVSHADELSLAARQAALLQSPPRKVVVATVCTSFGAQLGVEDRIAAIDHLIAEAGSEAERRYPGEGLDLCVLPEETLRKGGGAVPAVEKALRIDEEPVFRVAALAARQRTWLVLPMILSEHSAEKEIYSNAAVLIDRSGKVAGIYRKAHLVYPENGLFEGGITPGHEYPVFATDFGRLGIQICWDMSYEEGWKALAVGGAELVVLPSMSPQNVRLASYAQRFRYWVVNSTPRDNASVFNPIGLVDAQMTKPGVLVHRFDLISAVVHWSASMDEGRAFQRRFGKRGGFAWSTREDTGLFWSNDPQTSIGTMLKALGEEQMDAYIERLGSALRSTKP